MGMDKNCDNCSHSGKPSYEWPCTACTSAYGSAPSKWEGLVPASADMVEVVRCKDCKHYDNSEGINWCHVNSKFYPGGMDWHSFPEDGFCSYGERRTNVE